ncbi:hypothetical protein JTB14_020033 [Gonioctena quinquepunctata]|nr:hypothetical protein JTB14_020033 [Gonioctena quinquepunctata]
MLLWVLQEDGGTGEASSYNATGLKIIQANLNRSRAAHDLASAIVAEKNVDLLIVSEPNKKLIESQAWLKDERGDVAALFLNKSVEVNKVSRKRGFLWIHMSHCCMIMINISPNTGLDNYKRQLEEALEYGRGSGEEFCLVGDINAKAHQWGSPVVDVRGDIWSNGSAPWTCGAQQGRQAHFS